ncbi:hypothetical protein BBK36DRAFT_1193340 [Trichoderma citrinoviride]|uniref:Uncharacterized protein n=1 Tax=Trichoderma citrinoviride TaxID=58853 RepID=A0A2T4BIM9_9HYPO|nr:hypothetical protein BBK36DRAFT_1193340 [Trichoderma citrinoviride]PTB69138.1 hypothetical protein BBK36DRAFT_1193340 [Trichoderma citrinoviride]
MEKLMSDPSAGSKAASYPSLGRISKSAGNESIEKRSMSVQETGHHPLSFQQPSKMSRRRATSQIASPVVDFEVAIAEKPRKATQTHQPEDEPKSYYIINPKIPGSAWFITKGKRNSSKFEYQVERVPTHLVYVQQNRIGYLVETAIRDDVTGAVADQSVSWTPKLQSDSSTLTSSSTEQADNATGSQPGKRVNRFERDDSEGQVHTQPHDESNIILEHRDIPLITKSIIRQLRIAGFKQHHPSMEGDEAVLPEDDEELENTIKASLMGFRSPVQRSNTQETLVEEASPQSRLPAQSAWENANRHMKPRPSTVAGPAITLSTPQTAFTVADSSRKHSRQREASSMTRLVSPHSVTAKAWTKHDGHSGEPSEISASADNSPDKHSAEKRQSRSSNDHSQDQELQTSQASLGSSNVASTITSFPKLLSRHCTREWIKPIANLEDTSTSSSHQVMNTQTEDLSHHHRAHFDEDPVSMSWDNDTLHSSNASGYFANEAPSARRSTVSQPSMKNLKHFGTHLGSAAHRRRSCPAEDSKAAPSQDHFFPNILGKFFAGRRYGSPPKRTSTVSSEDRARIHEALVAGSGAAVDRRRRDTCSEDYRPHVCADDLDN